MKLKHNLLILNFHQFFFNFYPISALLVVYFYQITRSYTLAMAVFSLGSAIRSFVEIPAGIVTDKIGYRKTLMLVALLGFAGYLIWSFSGVYAKKDWLFIGAIFWGVSKALYSGTTEALIFRTAQALQHQGLAITYNEVFAKSNIYAQTGLAVSALLAVGISYYFSLQVLMWITLISLVLQIIIAGLFVEPMLLTKGIKVNTWTNLRVAFRLVWKNKSLKFFTLMSILNNAIERAVNNFEAVYFKSMVTDWMINLLRFTKQLFGIAGFIIISKLKKYHNLKVYTGAILANSAFRSTAAVLNCIISPFLMVFTNVFYGAFITSATSILQHEFFNRQRRTMQAFVSLIGSLAEVVILTFFGMLADIMSPRVSILFAAGINMAVLLLGRLLIKGLVK